MQPSCDTDSEGRPFQGQYLDQSFLSGGHLGHEMWAVSHARHPFVREDPTLFSNAEGAENEAEDVVGSGGAGNFVERAQGVVEVEQQHLVGDVLGHGG